MPKIITSDMFINDAITYWGDRYDYSLVANNWKNATTKIGVNLESINDFATLPAKPKTFM